MTDRDPVSSTLTELGRLAGLPRERAEALPAEAYRSQAFHALETANIFNVDWHCVGRLDELVDSGRYLTFEIAGEPVIVLRDAASAIRAFSNICRHRMARLLDGSGRVKAITCPYHAWTYDLSGRLKSAPHMADDFDPASVCLREFHTEVWGGFVYVSLASEPAALAPSLEGLARRTADFRLDRFRTLFRVDEIWRCNWKSLVENFTEPYHFPTVHRHTVEPALPLKLTEHDEAGGDGYSIFFQRRAPGSAFEHGDKAPEVNEALPEQDRDLQPIICVYPAHLIALSAERLFWVAAQPDGTDQTRVRWGVDAYPGAIPSGADGKKRVAEFRAAFERINAEDKKINEDIRRNADSPFARSGRLSPKERSLWEFQKYLARRLADQPVA